MIAILPQETMETWQGDAWLAAPQEKHTAAFQKLRVITQQLYRGAFFTSIVHNIGVINRFEKVRFEKCFPRAR